MHKNTQSRRVIKLQYNDLRFLKIIFRTWTTVHSCGWFQLMKPDQYVACLTIVFVFELDRSFWCIQPTILIFTLVFVACSVNNYTWHFMVCTFIGQTVILLTSHSLHFGKEYSYLVISLHLLHVLCSWSNTLLVHFLEAYKILDFFLQVL